ncbi:MAG TPA: hypothetical protein VMD05_02025 [Candidatus Nanoarchaeia archaeon]|nr:hypothetical protein [Candidatus Nanoarchaeia archaeon]
MFNLKSSLAVRIGIFLAAFAYFSFTFYECAVAVLHNTHPENAPYWVWVTDSFGMLGMGFRAAAGVIALLTSLFFLLKRDLSKAETLMSIRWVILLEALYWFVSLFPSGLWGLTILSNRYALTFLVDTTIPCLFESIAIPVVFSVLFIKINEKNLYVSTIKWGSIAGTVYIYVFWLNNFCNWAATVYTKGIAYITLFPANSANLFSFLLTSVGLLAIALYSTYLTVKINRSNDLAKIDLTKVGTVIVSFGLYFDIVFMLWIYLGSVGGWSSWYAWFFGHNADLWLMMVPLAGIPLLLGAVKSKAWKNLALSAQVMGVLFYGVFLASYAFDLPSNNNLIGNAAYRTPLAVFGGLLLILTFVCLAVAYAQKRQM